MSGFLEGYGSGDAQRERKVRWIVLPVVSVLLVGGALYAAFRDYREERRLNLFLSALQKQDFNAAYTYWGCTPEAPCRDYSMEKFLEDWGPKGVNTKFTSSAFSDSERCGTGFIGVLHSGPEELALWVERETGVISFCAVAAVPGKKTQADEMAPDAIREGIVPRPVTICSRQTALT